MWSSLFDRSKDLFRNKNKFLLPTTCACFHLLTCMYTRVVSNSLPWTHLRCRVSLQSRSINRSRQWSELQSCQWTQHTICDRSITSQTGHRRTHARTSILTGSEDWKRILDSPFKEGGREIRTDKFFEVKCPNYAIKANKQTSYC